MTTYVDIVFYTTYICLTLLFIVEVLKWGKDFTIQVSLTISQVSWYENRNLIIIYLLTSWQCLYVKQTHFWLKVMDYYNTFLTLYFTCQLCVCKKLKVVKFLRLLTILECNHFIYYSHNIFVTDYVFSLKLLPKCQ